MSVVCVTSYEVIVYCEHHDRLLQDGTYAKEDNTNMLFKVLYYPWERIRHLN